MKFQSKIKTKFFTRRRHRRRRRICVRSLLRSTERSSNPVMHNEFMYPSRTPICSGAKFFRGWMTSCPSSSLDNSVTLWDKLWLHNYSRKHDLRINLCCESIRANIRTTSRVEYRKLVRAFCLKTCRNISSFQQQDKQGILLWLVPSSAGFTCT